MFKISHMLPLLGLVSLTPVLPLLIFQGKSVKANALRLPVAKGALDNPSNKNALNLLHLGESTVAGVGVSHLNQGLTQAITDTVSAKLNRPIIGHTLAKNGANLADINQFLPPDFEADILIISLGVNDTTGFTSLKQWRQQLVTCVNKFATEKTQVFFTQVPNMSRFRALPKPLNWFLGLRAKQLDNALYQLCQTKHWQHIKMAMPIQDAWMAEDGYHPNAQGYQLWGEQTGNTIGAYLKPQLNHWPTT